jgi:hypothetical protein
MTAKDKAREMVDKIHEGLWRDRAVRICQEDAVYTALIAVDEIIKALNDDIYIQGETDIDSHIVYWKEVKQEIDNI